jgi:hypothetical protein
MKVLLQPRLKAMDAPKWTVSMNLKQPRMNSHPPLLDAVSRLLKIP